MTGAPAAGNSVADAERSAIDKYIKDSNVEQAIQQVLDSLLAAKPKNPRQWLLNRLEKELSDESEDLSESDLHRLFAVTRKITSEIVPQDTINMVISETLGLLHCDIISLFVLDKKSGMLRLYASNLETPILVSPGQGIAGSVFNSKETVNIPDCYKDTRFDKSFDRKSGYMTKSLLAVPIVDFDGCCVGVLQAINKMSVPADGVAPLPVSDQAAGKAAVGMKAVPFMRTDEKILWHLTQHVGIAMRNAEVYREAISSSERATGLLNTIQSLSHDLGTQSLLLTITMHANKIVSAQRSTVFLVDEEHQQLWSVSTDTGQEIRIPKKAGIAGQCCCEGMMINIPDAYADSRFNQEIDRRTGFKTQSILAIPMFLEGTVEEMADGSAPEVIGVIQMINKVSYDGQLEYFDESDIQVMELFAKFVGPKLSHSSFRSKRHSNLDGGTHGEKSEGEMALGAVKAHLDPQHHDGHAHRPSNVPAMEVLGEDAEDEEGEEEET